MKQNTEICYSNSYTINKANYENEKPFYSIKTVIEEHGDTIDAKEIYNGQRSLIDGLLTQQVRESKGENNFRIHLRDGVKCVSVGNVLRMAQAFVCPVCGADCQHATRGLYVEKIMESLLKADGMPVGGDKPPVLDKAPVDKILYLHWWKEFGNRLDPKAQLQVEVTNKVLKYIGIADYVGRAEVSEGVWEPAIGDWKCGSYKFEQLAPYAKALGIEWMIMFDLKNRDGYTKS
jgi:hypothetical protein